MIPRMGMQPGSFDCAQTHVAILLGSAVCGRHNLPPTTDTKSVDQTIKNLAVKNSNVAKTRAVRIDNRARTNHKINLH